jgi:hypothetical protein
LPETLRSDFGLEVTLLGAAPADGGVYRLRSGDTVRFRVKAERECCVGVWTVEADGTVVQLFPNDDEPDNHFQAGEERVVPKAGAEAVPSAGLDRVWVQASRRPWATPEGRKEGPFLLFSAERERKAWEGQRRGLRLKADQALSEKVLDYQVSP